MARIAGVDIPGRKHLVISLQYIYGIGPKISSLILDELKISPATRAKDLSEEQVSQLNQLIERKVVVEGQLRRQVMQNIQRLKEIKAYRGLRHIKGLPVRGQRTRTNARTRKGKARPIAGKKK